MAAKYFLPFSILKTLGGHHFQFFKCLTRVRHFLAFQSRKGLVAAKHSLEISIQKTHSSHQAFSTILDPKNLL
jgi:hypothetical protein